MQHTTTATFKNGWLDGTVTITKKGTLESKGTKYVEGKTETVNFKNGIPDGLWKIVTTEDNKTSTLISMTFTNGMLTGQFQWQDQTGQFDSEGRYSGTWTKRDYQTYIEHKFINGVNVSVIKRKNGKVIEKTPDEDIAIATKFANGEILESELENMKYRLKERDGLISTNMLPTKPFYWNNFDLAKIGGDKTLELEEYDKILGKPYIYLEKIKYDILPDNMFNCILVDCNLDNNAHAPAATHNKAAKTSIGMRACLCLRPCRTSSALL
jgi:antitoxin component YwqK of YwqJK toxin-antitoxin module